MSEDNSYDVDVEIIAPVYDTEVTDRVETAITNIFPEATITEGHGELRGQTDSLESFSMHLHRQQILDTAREQLFAGQQNGYIRFQLKKQAAYEDVVNFAVGDPDELGEITVTVTVEDPDVAGLIDVIAPRTKDGKPIDS